MPTTRLHAIAIALFAIAAPAPAQDPPRWSIGERPLVSIGDNDTDTLILRSMSALRLANGAIVVASNRDSKLRWFDANGRHVGTVGRRGQGPEEFGGGIYLYQGAGDTIVAHDERNRRFHYLSPAGRFLKLDTLGDRRRAAWAYNRTILFRIPGRADRTRLTQTLARIPVTTRDTVRLALADEAGNVWLEAPDDPRTFTVYAADGRAVGVVTAPPRFLIYQILDTLVLGHWRDEDDVEHIQLRRLTRTRGGQTAPAPAGPQMPAYDQAAELRAHGAIIARMEATLRNMLTAQEAYFADFVRYASTLEELGAKTRFAIPEPYKAALFRAQRNSYSVIMEHPATRITCVAILDGMMRPGAWAQCG